MNLGEQYVSKTNKMTAKKEEEEYNTIYNYLVNEDSGLVGMIAYALYKGEKIEYCKKITESKGKVDIEDIQNFHIAAHIRKDEYYERAVTLFRDLTNVLIENKIKEEKTLIETMIKKVVSPKGVTSWLRNITQSVIASLVYTIVVFGILLCIWFYNSGQKEKTSSQIKNMAKSTLHISEKDSLNKNLNQ